MKKILILICLFAFSNTLFGQSVLSNKAALHIPETSEIVVQTGISDKIKPLITLTSPVSLTSTTSKKTFRISGRATDGSGIFQVLLNGKLLNVDRENFMKVVDLEEGKNVFILKVFDKKLNESEKTFTITYKVKEAARKDYALLFYVSEYEGENIPNLSGTKKNAEKLAGILKNKYGFQTHIYPNYTASQIEKVLEEYQRKKYSANDQLLVYFSGHGERKETYNGKIKGALLCAKDSKISHLDFKDLVQNGCNHTLLILDACFSGLATYMGIGDEIIPDYQPSKKEYLAELFEGKSFRALTSGEGEGTIENEGLSYFTKALTEVLKFQTGKYHNILTYSELRLEILKKYKDLKVGKFNDLDNPKAEFLFIKK